MTKSRDSNAMWGGRFGGGPSAIMQEINSSLGVDQRLWREDIESSKGHAAMLRDQGIIEPEDADAILRGLDTIAGEYARDGVPQSVLIEQLPEFG